MKLWVGVTDEGWFNYLRARNPDEVNFWQPSSEGKKEKGDRFIFDIEERPHIFGEPLNDRFGLRSSDDPP